MDTLGKVSHLNAQQIETMPEELEHGVIYVSKKFQTAIHLCACGCGVQTVTPFRNNESGWSYSENAGGAVTLRPSIGNQKFPCGSHYWLTEGRIEWA